MRCETCFGKGTIRIVLIEGLWQVVPCPTCNGAAVDYCCGGADCDLAPSASPTSDEFS